MIIWIIVCIVNFAWWKLRESAGILAYMMIGWNLYLFWYFLEHVKAIK